jgi:anti-sigma factor RsiW
MNPEQFTERDIHLALDGELPPERMPEFARWLEANPEMKLRSARFGADRDRLRTALGPVAYEPVPAKLSAAIFGGGRDAFRLSPWWRGATAAALLAIGGAGGFAAAQFSSATTPQQTVAPVAERAVAAHRIYAAEKLHVVEVGADQKDHLVGWLSKRVGTPLDAPDLSGEGFTLVGGRLLPSGEKVAAQFMYQDASGNRISLYVTPAQGQSETGFRLLEHGDARAFYWLDGGFGYAIAGAVPEAVMQRTAAAAYRQLLQPGRTR